MKKELKTFCRTFSDIPKPLSAIAIFTHRLSSRDIVLVMQGGFRWIFASRLGNIKLINGIKGIHQNIHEHLI